MYTYMFMYIHTICMYIYMYAHTCVCIYIYIYRERERDGYTYTHIYAYTMSAGGACGLAPGRTTLYMLCMYVYICIRTDNAPTAGTSRCARAASGGRPARARTFTAASGSGCTGPNQFTTRRTETRQRRRRRRMSGGG